MVRIENFRTLDLYKRSIDLTMVISKAISNCEGNLSEKEMQIIRKKAVLIPNKIAAAISQVNMKVRFKKLNEAKSTVIQLKTFILELKKREQIDEQIWQEVDDCSIEVMKLLNGYFIWLSSNKSINHKLRVEE